MRPLHRKNMSEHSHPAGFTLIELLIVITIIGVLVGLTIRVLGKSKQKAEEAKVRAEISAFESSITTFNGTFFRNPPSRIVLYEAATGTTSWATHGAPGSPTDVERVRSKVLIRELWPEFNFGMDRDINGNNTSGEQLALTLTGAECLCFFLGGVPKRDVNGTYSTLGFSKNPADPFARPPAGSTNGLPPFFEFQSPRLVDVDGDLMLEYADSLSKVTPYLYVSSYDGRGYRPVGLDGKPGVAGIDDDGANGTDDLGEVGWPVSDDESPAGFTDVYRQSTDGTPWTGTPWKSSSYQIISAGADGFYGPGGLFDPSNTSNAAQTTRDNLTNFHNGRLVQ